MSDVKVKISSDSSHLSSGLNKAQGDVNAFSRRINNLSATAKGVSSNFVALKDKIGGAMAGLGALTVGVGAAAAAFNILHNMMSKAGDLTDLSSRLNVTAETVQKLQHLATKAGVDFLVLVKALEKGNNSALDATNGNEKLAKAFADLGISAQAYLSASPENQILMMTKALSEAENKTVAGANALDIMGQKAAALAPLFKQGTDGVRAQIESITTASNEQVAALDKWDSKIEDVFLNAQNVGFSALGALILKLEEFGDAMNRVAENSGVKNLGKTMAATGKSIARALLPGFALGEKGGEWAAKETLKTTENKADSVKPDALFPDSELPGEGGANADFSDKNAIAKNKARGEFLRNIRKGKEEVREALSKAEGNDSSAGIVIEAESIEDKTKAEAKAEADALAEKEATIKKKGVLDSFSNKLSESENTLGKLEGRNNAPQSDMLRRIGGGFKGANYSEQAKQATLLQKQIDFQRQTVDELKKVVESLKSEGEVTSGITA